MADIMQQGNSGNTVGAKHVTIGYNASGQRTSLNRYESPGATNWGYDSWKSQDTYDEGAFYMDQGMTELFLAVLREASVIDVMLKRYFPPEYKLPAER
jgi:hypothetical protein